MTGAKQKFGLIPANRGFFSDELAAKMRGETIEAMRKAGMEVVVPDENLTKIGCVETLEEAEKTAKLFSDNGVIGIVVAAVNFGEEQAVAWTIKESGLNVPIFIFGCQEEETLTPNTPRRDSFCGLLSIGEVLRQIGAKYTVAQNPICFPHDPLFVEDLRKFAAVCRVVTGVTNARYGQIGARPDSFWTCRFDEKSLQRLGVTTVTLDLSEVIGAIERMKDDADVKKKIEDIKNYCSTDDIPDSALSKIARFELFVERFAEEKNLDALAIQCWTSLQENLGICSCATMSRLGNRGIPCACESDIMGTLSMHALHLASQAPAGLADWNNQHNDDPDLVNVWHCGVFPAYFAQNKPKMGVQEIIAGSVGRENACGVVEFEMKTGPITLFRATQDSEGFFKSVIVEGNVEKNTAKTFGAYGWCRVNNLTSIYRDILLRHFPHHVGFTAGNVADVLWEAFGNYLGFDVYAPNQKVPVMWTPENPFRK